jgi:hypothetical protein
VTPQLRADAGVKALRYTRTGHLDVTSRAGDLVHAAQIFCMQMCVGLRGDSWLVAVLVCDLQTNAVMQRNATQLSHAVRARVEHSQ